jgi:hypothetical protein
VEQDEAEELSQSDHIENELNSRVELGSPSYVTIAKGVAFANV